MLDDLDMEFEEMDMEELQEEVDGGLSSGFYNASKVFFQR